VARRGSCRIGLELIGGSRRFRECILISVVNRLAGVVKLGIESGRWIRQCDDSIERVVTVVAGLPGGSPQASEAFSLKCQMRWQRLTPQQSAAECMHADVRRRSGSRACRSGSTAIIPRE
jgi:hypothetical protein